VAIQFKTFLNYNFNVINAVFLIVVLALDQTNRRPPSMHPTNNINQSSSQVLLSGDLYAETVCNYN
jgi:hypothetical protein